MVIRIKKLNIDQCIAAIAIVRDIRHLAHSSLTAQRLFRACPSNGANVADLEVPQVGDMIREAFNQQCVPGQCCLPRTGNEAAVQRLCDRAVDILRLSVIAGREMTNLIFSEFGRAEVDNVPGLKFFEVANAQLTSPNTILRQCANVARL